MRNQRMVSNVSKALAVGAAGKFAGLVIPEFARRGAAVRGLVKTKIRSRPYANAMRPKSRSAILGNQTSVCVALDGADSVFYVAPVFLHCGTPMQGFLNSWLFGSVCLARMVGNDGITVNVVAPGLTLTPPVARSMPPEMIEAQVKARDPARREG
jgi:tetrahydromethanopterin S-methyltransferase subunit C